VPHSYAFFADEWGRGCPELRYLMPSHLRRYQTEGSYYFVTFSYYQRAPLLNNDHAGSSSKKL